MIAEQLINQMIPPLKVSDSVEKALSWMDEFRVSQLPIVKSRKFLGLILEHDDFDANVENIEYGHTTAFVMYHQHFYDVMKVAVRDSVQIVAVLDEQQDFLGVITVTDAIAALSQMFAMQGTGGIIVLAMPERDYSLSQISRLIEAEDAKIMSAYVTADETDPYRIHLTLKINRTDLTRILSAFERFKYHIVAQFDEVETGTSGKDRLDALMKYLSM
jgi:acetoin utilization protein AcuB